MNEGSIYPRRQRCGRSARGEGGQEERAMGERPPSRTPFSLVPSPRRYARSPKRSIARNIAVVVLRSASCSYR